MQQVACQRELVPELTSSSSSSIANGWKLRVLMPTLSTQLSAALSTDFTTKMTLVSSMTQRRSFGCTCIKRGLSIILNGSLTAQRTLTLLWTTHLTLMWVQAKKTSGMIHIISEMVSKWSHKRENIKIKLITSLRYKSISLRLIKSLAFF